MKVLISTPVYPPELQRQQRKVLVVTVDPARRLATALGLDGTSAMVWTTGSRPVPSSMNISDLSNAPVGRKRIVNASKPASRRETRAWCGHSTRCLNCSAAGDMLPAGNSRKKVAVSGLYTTSSIFC